jgi:hypothetical protein
MSHAVAWLCRAAACRFVLGQVRVGVLHPLVPVESVDGRGVARMPCPRCGRVRMWLPAPTASGRLGSDRNVEIAALCERVSGP